MGIEAFWTVVCYAVVVGIGALACWVFLYLPFHHEPHS